MNVFRHVRFANNERVFGGVYHATKYQWALAQKAAFPAQFMQDID
jgi:hypothetical protein